MAKEEKKSFLTYGEWERHLLLLSMEERGELFTALLHYFNTGEVNELQGMVSMAFSFMQAQMDRDAEKYDKRCETNRQNGSKGGRPRKTEHVEDKPTESKETERFSEKAKKPDKDIDIDKDEDIEKDLDSNTLSGKSPRESVQTERFNMFWQAYPKKIGKQAALKAWNKIKPTSELFGCIMSAVERYKRSPDWTKENGRFIPNPTTWLNQGRWDDEITEVNNYGASQGYYVGGGYGTDYTRRTRGTGTGTPAGFKPAEIKSD